MKFDDITKQSLLYDFYGELLTKRQREVMELYNEENLSLAEIAEEFGISRQGVHDALHKAQKALEEYERKLGLVERFSATRETIGKISSEIDQTIQEIDGATEAAAQVSTNSAAGQDEPGERSETSETVGSAERTDGKVAGRLKQIRNEIEQLEI